MCCWRELGWFHIFFSAGVDDGVVNIGGIIVAITEQHFQLLNSAKPSVRHASVIRPSCVSFASWLAAATTAGFIGGTAGLLTGGLLLLAVPAAWMAFEIHHSETDSQA